MSIQTVEQRMMAKTAAYTAKNGKDPSPKLEDSWKAQFTAEYESELEASQDDDDVDDDVDVDDDDDGESFEVKFAKMKAENARLKATIETIKPSRGAFGLSPVTIWINDAKLTDVQIRTMLGLDSQTPITSKPQRDGSDRKMVKLGKSGQTLAKLQACMSLWSTQKLDIK